ncbi:MAG: hypothetical protein NTV06_08880 [candidate division Zixibacteria bacterium]|nr:hypothetical protein [candidate division Zixibacteria bacterium]
MRKLILFFIIALMVLAGAGKAPASTSSAAVLFLRIAAGARAAGMGEAFVAIADDATATHWNPAGLGNYPLSSKWFDVDVPDQYQPLGKIALYKNDGSDIDYNRYDIWALSPRGLIRCSKGKWRQGDIIQTTPDQTAESILRQYTGLVGDAADKKLPLLMENIGRINNAYPRERIDSLKNVVMETLSAKYTGQSDLENLFIALDKAYNQCRVDWEMFNKAAELSRNALRDSVIDELEADKILFAVEKSRRRVLAPQMVIPYDINFNGRLHDIAADDDYLWVAAETGLYRYSGKNWQRLPVAEKGIAVDNIRMIKLAAKRAYLGTDTGLFVYDQGAFKYYGMAAGLPEQAVQAITVSGENNIWAIIGTDLYHFDGSSWRNYFFYNDVLGETDSSIYESMKIYGTADEREQYLTKLKALNPSRPDSIGPVKKSSSEVTPLGTTALGREIKIPYMARMKYDVTDIGLDSHGGLWIGTQYGLLRFNGREWNRLGYKEYTSTNDISIYELALTMRRVWGEKIPLILKNKPIMPGLLPAIKLLLRPAPEAISL